MNDRELLQAAARAAGYNFQWEPALLNEWPEPTVFTPEGFGQYWNALEDDADAFRLAVDLGILGTPEMHHHIGVEQLCGQNSDCIYAATRRAIVRAAAALGEQHDQ